MVQWVEQRSPWPAPQDPCCFQIFFSEWGGGGGHKWAKNENKKSFEEKLLFLREMAELGDLTVSLLSDFAGVPLQH